MIDIFVPSTPVAQGRPRTAVRGGRAIVYDPDKSRNYKMWIATHLFNSGAVKFANDIPLILSLTVYLPKPKSTKREYPIVKPDLDNYIKGITDACKDFFNDQQIIQIVATKLYSDRVGIHLTVREYKK